MDASAFRRVRINLHNVSAYLIHNGDRAMLIDSGRRGSADRILKAMKQEGLSPGQLEWLVLTHSHYDHAGSAAALKKSCGCRVLVHHSEAARLRRGKTPMPRGTRWKARVLTALGRGLAPWILSYRRVDPDAELSGDANLEDYGFPGSIWHLPGHSPGSIGILWPDGSFYCGDVVFGLAGKELFPPFAEDVSGLLESWDRLAGLPFKTLYPGHGRPISAAEFLAAQQLAREKYG